MISGAQVQKVVRDSSKFEQDKIIQMIKMAL